MHPINTSVSVKNPTELQEHLSWLLNHGYEAVIKEKVVKGNSTFAVWRNPKPNDANFPALGYWKWTGRGFWREDENPQKMTDCICPTCKRKHKSSTGGKNTFCSKCRPASRKSEGYGCPKDGSSQSKSKRSNA